MLRVGQSELQLFASWSVLGERPKSRISQAKYSGFAWGYTQMIGGPTTFLGIIRMLTSAHLYKVIYLIAIVVSADLPVRCW